jgi:hypothetical protein
MRAINLKATQEYSHFEDFHTTNQRWIENHIYPLK